MCQKLQSSAVSVVKSFHCQGLNQCLPECKKPKIDLNMPFKNIPIEVLDEIEENLIQTAINKSQPDEPSQELQDFTTQNVDPDEPELLITDFIAAPLVEFQPLNYVQRKEFLLKFSSLILTSINQKCSMLNVV